MLKFPNIYIICIWFQVAQTDDGYLHIISSDRVCRHALRLGESSLASVLSYDLIPQAPGQELLVSTRDGSLMCLGQTWDGKQHPEDHRKSVLDGYPAELRTHNGFLYSHSKVKSSSFFFF